MRHLLIAATVILASCAATPRELEQAAAARSRTADALDRELAGLVPGPASACLPVVGRPQVQSKTFGSTIVYAVSRDVKYRNETTGGCEQAGRNAYLVTQTPQSRSCSGDIVRAVDRGSGFQVGSCALGEFVSYRRP